MSHPTGSPLGQYGEHTKEVYLCAHDGLFEIWDDRPDGMKRSDPEDIKTKDRHYGNDHQITAFGRPYIHFFKSFSSCRRRNSKVVSNSPRHRLLILFPSCFIGV